MAAVNNFRLYLSTVRHLKKRQLFHLAKQRLLPRPRVNIGKGTAIRVREGVKAAETIPPEVMQGGDYSFRFLNVARSFPSSDVDWVCSEMPKLWRYNLHYFDYLLDNGRSLRAREHLVSSWIANNRIGSEDAWEPYTVSLRIVNWVKWFSGEGSQAFLENDWRSSLYMQAAWLEKNIEYHLLANHYLKNAKALIFAGAFFYGPDAARWLRKGLTMLSQELPEQILPDGGHCERSPMYHCLVVEDLLDILAIALSNPSLVTNDFTAALRGHVIAALDFLDAILVPGDRIPLFNDSAFGIAPDPAKLFGYARKLIGYQRPERGAGICIAENPDSGYYVIRDDYDMLIVDCGPIGPPYQPGHAHCDTLSYELYLDGRPIVVDSGVYDYENSAERRYARSSRAHNTLVIDGCEQSEIWGVFRVGRRANVIGGSLKKNDGDRVIFRGAHDGYRRLAGNVIHRRMIEYSDRQTWLIRDELSGSGVYGFENFIHFAPGLEVTFVSSFLLQVTEAGAERVVAWIELPKEHQVELASGWYFPEFGISEENSVVKIYGDVALPFRMGYTILNAMRAVHNKPI